MPAEERRWQHRVVIPVQFRDIDAMGHVNNAVYLAYCEQARTEMYVRLAGKKDVTELDFVVARAEIDFRSSARAGESVEVLVRTVNVGDSSWVLEYLLRAVSDGRALAEARTVQVHFDYSKREKLPVPAALREKLLEFNST